MEKTIANFEKIIMVAVSFLMPLLFLPIFPNVFETPKLLLLSLAVALLLITKITKMIISKKLEIKVGKFDFPLFIIMLAYLLSAIIVTPNKMDAFFLPGNASLIIFSFLFYFLVNQFGNEIKSLIKLSLSVSGVVVSLISLLAISKVFAQIPGLPEYIKNTQFTTLGGNLYTAMFLGIVSAISFAIVKSQKEMVQKAFWAVVLGVVTLGLLANIYIILPGKPASPKFPSTKIFWSIAVDTLKESPVLGIGPGNYLTSFARFRPIEYNQTEFWNLKFSNANSFFITMLTESGLLAITGLILLLLITYSTIKEKIKKVHGQTWDIGNDDLLPLIISMVLLFLFPANATLVFIFFLLFSFVARTTSITLHLGAQGLENSSSPVAERIPSILVAIPIALAIAFYGYYMAVTVSAEYTFQKSLSALATNDGVKTYDLMRQTISKNPFSDRYHVSLAQVSMAIANNISAGKKAEEITDQDKQNITILIQQAIQEGKSAVTLNPTRSDNWTLLGSVYRQVISVAEGADQFAIDTYTQAVALEPISPTLRIDLGGLYYAIGDYDRAIDTFKVAVIAKPDLANARYNLAIAYREKGDITNAIAEMKNVLSLVEKDSADYELAQKELENLESKKPAESPAPEGENLNAPEKLDTQVEAPIELPEEAKPPEVSPTPTPTSTPSGDTETTPTTTPTIEP